MAIVVVLLFSWLKKFHAKPLSIHRNTHENRKKIALIYLQCIIFMHNIFFSPFISSSSRVVVVENYKTLTHTRLATKGNFFYSSLDHHQLLYIYFIKKINLPSLIECEFTSISIASNQTSLDISLQFCVMLCVALDRIDEVVEKMTHNSPCTLWVLFIIRQISSFFCINQRASLMIHRMWK